MGGARRDLKPGRADFAEEPVASLKVSRIRLAFAGISVILAASACGSGAVQVPPTPPPPSPTAPSSPTAASSPPRSSAAAPKGSSVQQLAGEVSDARAFRHLQALQKIADEHGGNRASGTAGYDASVDYVVGVLRDAGFKASTPTYDGDGSSGRNVIAQSRTGDPGHVVMIGAHLDSVEDGPGIVDNGSGVAALLEIATQLGDDPLVQNTVRFAFFGGEENGAEGSTAYVEGLSADNRGKIKLYLNVDMVASPNGGYFVQGGKGNDPEEAGPPGSATIAAGACRPADQDWRNQPGDHRIRRGRRIGVHRGGHSGRRRRERRRRGQVAQAGQSLGRAGRRAL